MLSERSSADTTYVLNAFDVSPMLFFHSPLPECGKSRALALIKYLAYRGLMAASIIMYPENWTAHSDRMLCLNENPKGDM